MERRLAWAPRGILGGRSVRDGNCRVGRELLQCRSRAGAAMNFQLIGVNHKTAPVEVREQLAIPERKLPQALQQLMGLPGVGEAMILCTCNRVEILAQTVNGSTDIRKFIQHYCTLEPASYQCHLDWDSERAGSRVVI